MLDTLRIARTLTDAELTPAQAEAIAGAVREAAEQDEYVTREGLRAELAELRSDLYRAMLIQGGANRRSHRRQCRNRARRRAPSELKAAKRCIEPSRRRPAAGTRWC